MFHLESEMRMTRPASLGLEGRGTAGFAQGSKVSRPKWLELLHSDLIFWLAAQPFSYLIGAGSSTLQALSLRGPSSKELVQFLEREM